MSEPVGVLSFSAVSVSDPRTSFSPSVSDHSCNGCVIWPLRDVGGTSELDLVVQLNLTVEVVDVVVDVNWVEKHLAVGYTEVEGCCPDLYSSVYMQYVLVLVVLVVFLHSLFVPLFCVFLSYLHPPALMLFSALNRFSFFFPLDEEIVLNSPFLTLLDNFEKLTILAYNSLHGKRKHVQK